MNKGELSKGSEGWRGLCSLGGQRDWACSVTGLRGTHWGQIPGAHPPECPVLRLHYADRC